MKTKNEVSEKIQENSKIEFKGIISNQLSEIEKELINKKLSSNKEGKKGIESSLYIFSEEEKKSIELNPKKFSQLRGKKRERMNKLKDQLFISSNQEDIKNIISEFESTFSGFKKAKENKLFSFEIFCNDGNSEKKNWEKIVKFLNENINLI